MNLTITSPITLLLTDSLIIRIFANRVGSGSAITVRTFFEGNYYSFTQSTLNAGTTLLTSNNNWTGTNNFSIGITCPSIDTTGTLTIGNTTATTTTIGRSLQTTNINGTTTILGVTNINTTGFNNTTIGNDEVVTNIRGFINIGTSGIRPIAIAPNPYSGVVTIGNTEASAINIVGPLNLNVGGNRPINIGTGGYNSTITIGNSASSVNIAGNFAISSQRPTWYITGNGSNGYILPNRIIGATYSTGTGTGLLNILTTYGGATASDYSTTNATFTASVAGTYFFQFNIFNSSTTISGRTIRFTTTSFMGNQYCFFNIASTTTESCGNWTALIYLAVGNSAYFFNESGATLNLYFGGPHSNLTITRLF
jgi:hypothetical protein